MKKLFFLLFFVTIFSGAFAQKIDIYGKLGVNVTSLAIDGGSANTLKSQSPIGSFNAQLYADLNYGWFSIQPGFLLTGKGGEYANSGAARSIRIYYIEIPVNFVFNLPLGKNSIFIGGGPYAAAGAGGVLRKKVQPKTLKSNLNLFKSTSDYRIGDVGAGGIIGFKSKTGYIFSANYEAGVANILADRANASGDQSMKNRAFSFSVGHVF